MDATSFRHELLAQFYRYHQWAKHFRAAMEQQQQHQSSWTSVEVQPQGMLTSAVPTTPSSYIDVDADLRPQWIWLVLVSMPISCIVGNTLVVAAVLSNKSLQTPTNYLLVSLACADLMVGTLVAPFHIYMTINSLHWHLPALTCYIYCVLDVLASTSSIIHLLLISMDRLVAATKPAEYKTQKHKRRVYVAIALCWLFSALLSLPLVFGTNEDTERYLLEEHHCGIYNPTYMFSSSIFAFFLPLFLMSLIYGYIFYTLKRRLRAIQLQEMAGGQFLGFGTDLGNIATSAMETVIGIDQKNRNMITWEKPLLKKIEETAAEHASSLNESEREQLQHILQAASSSTGSRASENSLANNNNKNKKKVKMRMDTMSQRKRSRRRDEENELSSASNIFIIEDREEEEEVSHDCSLVLDAVTAEGPQYSKDQGESSNDGSSSGTNLGSNSNHHHPPPSSNLLSVNMNTLEVPSSRMGRRRHSEDAPRRLSGISATLLVDDRERLRKQRRLSLQTPEEKRRAANRAGQGNQLKPPNRIGSKKSMRRLSELISGWERPSRSSLGQLLAFARRDSVFIARKKLAGLKDWALDLIAKLKSKQGLAIRREARATKLVATVMGVFLICWAPYFSMNLYKIYHLYHGGWEHESEFTFHWLSALGYLNSSLNFFIYSAINKKFRITFWRLLGLRRSHRKKSWMLPPPRAKKPKRRRKGRAKEAPGGGSFREGGGAATPGGRSVSVTTYGGGGTSGGQEKGTKKAKVERKSRERGRGPGGKTGAGTGGGSPAKSGRKKDRKKRFVSLIPLSRHLSIRKPQIIIEDLENSPNIKASMSISAGGDTTYRRSSDDCIQRSCSEVFGGGIVFPSGAHHNHRRGSAMSNSSASLQLYDIHQIEAQSAEEMAEVEIKPEIFV